MSEERRGLAVAAHFLPARPARTTGTAPDIADKAGAVTVHEVIPARIASQDQQRAIPDLHGACFGAPEDQEVFEQQSRFVRAKLARGAGQ